MGQEPVDLRCSVSVTPDEWRLDFPASCPQLFVASPSCQRVYGRSPHLAAVMTAPGSTVGLLPAVVARIYGRSPSVATDAFNGGCCSDLRSTSVAAIGCYSGLRPDGRSPALPTTHPMAAAAQIYDRRVGGFSLRLLPKPY